MAGDDETSKKGSTRSRSRPPLTNTDVEGNPDQETRITKLESLVVAMKTQINDLNISLDDVIQESIEVTKVAKHMIEEFKQETKKELDTMLQDLLGVRKFVEDELHGLREEMESLKRDWKDFRQSNNFNSGSTSGTSGPSIKVPKPDMFNGTRNATIVENFIFGLEQYFDALGVTNDIAKINHAPTFLRESAQLWWRRKHSEIEKGTCVIEKWSDFKAELRKYFVPHNADTEAKARLRRLHQKGTISDYIKEFTTIMLEIEDFSDRDALFYFKDGLQEWAQIELDRRNVHTLDEAIAAAESLVELSSKLQDNIFEITEEEQEVIRDNTYRSSPPKRGKPRPSLPCFICSEDHWTSDCPTRKTINSIIEKEENKHKEESKAHIGTMRQLGALVRTSPNNKTSVNGLLFADVKINNKKTFALIDTGASHNFIDVREAKRLGIWYRRSRGKIKAVNSEANPILGTAKVKACIKGWRDNLKLTVTSMDDFKVVLGLDFFRQAQAFPIPSTRSLVFLHGNQVHVTRLKEENKGRRFISSMQLDTENDFRLSNPSKTIYLDDNTNKPLIRKWYARNDGFVTRTSRNQVGENVTRRPFQAQTITHD